jgi:putative ABC transport system substrate-binding protein
MSTELSPKRLEFAKQLVPGAKRVVYLHNPNQGAIGLELTLKAAAQLGLTVRAVEMRSPAERDQAFAAIAADRPDVLLVYPDAVTFLSRKEIAEFALAQRLPSVYAYVHYAEAGGLLSYGSTLTERGRARGQDPARREAERSADRASNARISHDQHENRPRHRPCGSAAAAGARRAGDRMTAPA